MTVSIDSQNGQVWDLIRGSDKDLQPIVPYLDWDDDGKPALKGTRCNDCSAILPGTLQICPACGARSGLSSIVLATIGRLYNYTTVHRSLPGIATPFIFAIVDLDGGGTVKGNLVATDGDIAFDMPVRAVFQKLDRADSNGRAYLSYHFVKA